MSDSTAQFEKAGHAPGFIAALDQSGGSTPKALLLYGIAEDAYAGEAEMFAKVHAMRARIITNDAFTGDSILAAILFEHTMDGVIGGKPSARYLWEDKRIIPILKVDKGLADEAGGVQLMNPNPGLDALLDRALEHGIFGTKMRSMIKRADAGGIATVVEQQFEVGAEILARGLTPIIEPEVDIHSPQKAEAEAMLQAQLIAHLDALGDGQRVMLKLTLPDTADLYRDCAAHPNCLRMAALSGGYSRAEACRRLAENRGMVASFSRALTEGLSVSQTDAEFTATLRDSIDAIAAASAT
ncbi:MAG: fructose bisphosphate aldolase [Gammaproteobacteria bacterium]|nr:fructose bisphosphate aldolase [Gammaproteobacteria bacterium]